MQLRLLVFRAPSLSRGIELFIHYSTGRNGGGWQYIYVILCENLINITARAMPATNVSTVWFLCTNIRVVHAACCKQEVR